MQRDLASSSQRAVKGTVSDRPWGVTLAGLGLGQRSGLLTLRAADASGDRPYRISFFRGSIVGASSPLPVDSVVRVALTSRMIATAQVNELKLRLKAAPERDEVDVIAEAAQLAPELAAQLRSRVIAQRAARTFAVDAGEYLFEDRITALGVEGDVNVRTVIYLGVRSNLAQHRLAHDLRQLGTTFVLPSNANLAPFELTDEEAPILAALRLGTSLAELEATFREVDPRTAQAVVYALAACDVITRVEPQTLTIGGRTPTPRAPTMSRVPTPREPTMSRAETAPWAPTISRVPTPRQPTATGTRPRVSRAMTDPFVEMRTTAVRPNALTVREIEELIVARSALIDRGTDHFELLGLPLGASVEEVRAAYAELARYLEPRRLVELGIRDDGYRARRLFAQVCIAVTVLTDVERRAEYLGMLCFGR